MSISAAAKHLGATAARILLAFACLTTGTHAEDGKLFPFPPIAPNQQAAHSLIAHSGNAGVFLADINDEASNVQLIARDGTGNWSFHFTWDDVVGPPTALTVAGGSNNRVAVAMSGRIEILGFDGFWYRAAEIDGAPDSPVVMDWSGDRLVVLDSPVSVPLAGSVQNIYIYHNTSPGNWELEQEITAGSGSIGDIQSYLADVALNGDTLAYSLYSANSIQIYERLDEGGGASWSLTTTIERDEGFGLGTSMAFAGDTLVAAGYGASPNAQEGLLGFLSSFGFPRVETFEKDAGGPGNWGHTGTLVTSEALPGAGMFRVAADGDHLVIMSLPKSIDLGSDSLIPREFLGLPKLTPEFGEVQCLVYDVGANLVLQEQFVSGVFYGGVQRIPVSILLPSTGLSPVDVAPPAPIVPSISNGELLLGLAPDDYPNGGAAWALSIHAKDTGGPNEWGLEQVLDGPGDPLQFGNAVDMFEDLLVVGMPDDRHEGTDTGAAMIWRNADTSSIPLFNPIGRLQSTNPAERDDFGFDVAVGRRGEEFQRYIVVGAPGEDGGRGAVYVFKTSGSFVRKIKPTGLDPNDDFGYSVDLFGGYLAVGCPGFDSTFSNRGAVFLYDSSTWTLVKRLDQPDVAKWFGSTVALMEDRLAVGRLTRTQGGGQDGRIFVFGKDEGGANNWGLERTLDKPAGAPDGFGAQISADDSNLPNLTTGVLAVGAPGGGSESSGKAYVYYTPTASLPLFTATGTPALGRSFGESVAINNYNLAVGAPEAESSDGWVGIYGFQDDFAGAYEFWADFESPVGTDEISRPLIPDAATWGLRAVSQAGSNDKAGTAVAASSINGVSYFAYGAPLDDIAGLNHGAVHIVRRGGYEIWASLQGPDFTDWLPWQNPDDDDMINLREFGEDGNPLAVDFAAFDLQLSTEDEAMTWATKSLPHGTSGLWRIITFSTELESFWVPNAVFRQHYHPGEVSIFDTEIQGGVLLITPGAEAVDASALFLPSSYNLPLLEGAETNFYREYLFYPGYASPFLFRNDEDDDDGGILTEIEEVLR